MVRSLLFTLIASLMGTQVFAAHPLITDDTGTQGKGNTQIEFLAEYGRSREAGAIEEDLTFPSIPTISYGLTEDTDLLFGASYRYRRWNESGDEGTVRGITDATIELKKRFFEKRGFSLAVKPGVTLPTGDERKDLGVGRVTYRVFLIASKEHEPWAVHLNLGYVRNENSLNQRKDLWHTSVAGVITLTGKLKAVGNAGIEQDPDTDSSRLRFAVGGLILSLRDNLDLDMGVKVSTNGSTRGYAVPFGLTWRF